jgi:hypothetical protein
MADELSDCERRVHEQEVLIKELRTSGAGAGWRVELDAATSELEGLRALLRGGRDIRRENEELRAELRSVKEEQMAELESSLAQARAQLARAEGSSRTVAAARTKELFLSFVGDLTKTVEQRVAGRRQVATGDLTRLVFEAGQECATRAM